MIAVLDYQNAEIFMHCTTDIEATKRLTACEKEPETIAWIEDMRPGDVLLDVGANTGAYSLVAASRQLVVHAVEPHVPTFRRLVDNLNLNEGYKVVAHNFALGAHDGMVTLIASSDDPGAASHRLAPGNGIDCWKLDTLVSCGYLPRPDHVKIDTDGHEPAVLAGAVHTLSTALSVLVETDPRNPDVPAETTLGIHEALLDAGLTYASSHPHGWNGIINVIYRRDP